VRPRVVCDLVPLTRNMNIVILEGGEGTQNCFNNGRSCERSLAVCELHQSTKGIGTQCG